MEAERRRGAWERVDKRTFLVDIVERDLRFRYDRSKQVRPFRGVAARNPPLS